MMVCDRMLFRDYLTINIIAHILEIYKMKNIIKEAIKEALNDYYGEIEAIEAIEVEPDKRLDRIITLLEDIRAKL